MIDSMDFKVKCTEVENKEDYYDLEISTYKDSIKGRFEMSEIRHMIGILDNAINVGTKIG
jgi:hypothetical protein